MLNNIDYNLYSRQLYVIGNDGMEKIINSSILLSGLDGLGIEIAKCLVLGGIKKLYIHDNTVINMKDLSSSYYYLEKDIGKYKKDILINKLKELNQYVEIIIVNNLLEDYYNNINLVIIANYENFTFSEIININKKIHKLNKKFICCSTLGLFGQIFCDFNNKFIINDKDGEELQKGIIIKIENNNLNLICETANNHNLYELDKIKIMYNNKEYITKIEKICNLNKFIINIDDFFNSIDINNISNLTYEQIKEYCEIDYNDIENNLYNYSKVSSFNIYDNNHTLFCHKLFLEYHKLYELNDLSNKELELKEKFYKSKDGNFCPLQSIIGSIVAQEALKAITNKFTPINQWLYFDELELIDLNNTINIDNNSRYLGQEIIFGSVIQEKIKNSKIFIVGAGAIGCEHLKNFTMIGVGNIIITDMDIIEKSNLNRQFLFNNNDIGKYKSITASQKIKDINKEINIESHINKISIETENIYNNDFFKDLTCIANALDNINSRLYVDSLCVKYNKPLLESGTMGTKGNIQTIIPKLTESYGSKYDPPEKSIPLCTLKSFPYMIEHVIQYARDYFEGIFVIIPEKINNYITNKQNYLNSLSDIELNDFYNELRNIIIPNDFYDCIKYSINLWYILFNHQIQTLIKNSNTENNENFWSGTKICPKFREFNINNNNDIQFILITSKLYAQQFNIIINYDNNIIIDLIKECNINYINYNEILNREQLNDKIINILNNINNKLYINIFDKDNDDNNHINFIYYFSNLRAENYQIKPVNKLETKKIAGKIIPAIATTTSLVSGLVAIEFIKIILEKNKLEDYKNYFINLALPLFTYSNPGKVKKNKLGNNYFTIWDSFKFSDCTLITILEFFTKNYNININMMTIGNKMLYSSFMNINKINTIKYKKISELYLDLFNDELNNVEINITGENIDDEDIDINIPNIYINKN